MKSAFKLTANPVFRHMVPVTVPVDGGTEVQELAVTYRVFPTEVLARMEAELSAVDLALAIVREIGGVVDSGGEALPMNDDLQRRVLGLPFVTLAVIKHYREAMAGAAAKN